MTSVRYVDVPRDVILVEGADARSFLHSQLAQDIVSLDPGSSVYSFLLEPTGHVCVVCRVVCHDEETFTLDVESGFGESIIVRLKRFVLRSRVAMRTAEATCRAFRGDGASDAVGSRTGRAEAWWGGDDSVDVITLDGEAPSVGEPMDLDDLDAMRVAAGWPSLGRDIEVGDVPAATGLVRLAASFTKGCYPGQELVERMDSRGASAPVLVRHLAGSFVVGEAVVVDDAVVGVVTSASGVHALARVKRDAPVGVPPGAALGGA